MRKVLFLDRDGVINKDVNYLYKVSDLEWVDGAKEALAYAYSKGYDLIVVTNQSGVARGYYKESDVQILHDHMAHELDRSGAPILHFYYCPHHKEGSVPLYAVECECRKPKPGMLMKAAEDFNVDLERSWMIGDGENDVLAGKNAGCKTVLIGNQDYQQDYTVSSLKEFVDRML